MANTFVLIVQQPLEFHGQHYEPGDRLIADWSESPGLKRSGQAVLASEEEQRAHGAHDPALRTASLTPHTTPRRPRGRPRKLRTEEVVTEETAEASTYQRRDLRAEE